MFFGIQNLFGSLPDQPPSSRENEQIEHSKFQCTSKNQRSKSTKNNSNRTKSSNQTHKYQYLNTDSTDCFIRAISQAREKSQCFKTSHRYEFYANKASNKTDPNLSRNFEKLKRSIVNSEIDSKYQDKLREKSMKVGTQNKRKSQILMRKRQSDFKQQQQNLQKSIFYKLADKRTTFQKNMHNKVMELEKQKTIEDRRKFKESMNRTNEFVNQRMTSTQIQMQHRTDQVIETLKEIKTVKRINQIDQKKVIMDLQKELKEEEQRINDNFRQQLQNQKQRTSLCTNLKR